MAHAYTPGLKVTQRMTCRSRRLLPVRGEVLVEEGDRVAARDVVARALMEGDITPINIANLLAMPPGDVPEVLLKKEGDRVEEGAFSEALYACLSVIVLEVPSLRHRAQDIAPLAQHFLQECLRKGGGSGELRWDPATVEILGRYSWPANVSELAAVVSAAVDAAGDSGAIIPDHLPPELTSAAGKTSSVKRR